MRKVITRSLAVTAALGGLFFGGLGVVTATAALAATPIHTDVIPSCPLGTHWEPVEQTCIAF